MPFPILSRISSSNSSHSRTKQAVHQGFAQAVLEVWDDIRKDLEKLKQEKPERRLFFLRTQSGRSFGDACSNTRRTGGIERRRALYLWFTKSRRQDIRPKKRRKRHYRIANYGDMITQVPPGIPAIPQLSGKFLRAYGHTVLSRRRTSPRAGKRRPDRSCESAREFCE